MCVHVCFRLLRDMPITSIRIVCDSVPPRYMPCVYRETPIYLAEFVPPVPFFYGCVIPNIIRVYSLLFQNGMY